MDIHHIRYFLAVCETLNFTRAAEKCNVTQPALSRADPAARGRSGRPAVPPRAQPHPHHRSRHAAAAALPADLDELSGVHSEASQFLCLNDAHLKVGIMCTIGPRRFTGLLTDFNRRHKGIQLQLVEGVPAKLSALLEAGELDVAIMSTSENFPERFDVTPLFRERFMLAFPAGHRLSAIRCHPDRGDRRRDLSAARQLRVLGPSVGSLRRAGVRRIDLLFERARGLDPEHGRWRAGYLFHPRIQRRHARLQVRPVAEPEVTREVCLVTVAGRRFSPAVLDFRRAVKSYGWAEGRHRFRCRVRPPDRNSVGGRLPAARRASRLRCAQDHAIASGYGIQKYPAFLLAAVLAQSPSCPARIPIAGLDKRRTAYVFESHCTRNPLKIAGARPARLCGRLPAVRPLPANAPPTKSPKEMTPGEMMPKDVTDEVISSIDLSPRATPGRTARCACASSSCSPAASCRGIRMRHARPTS